MSIVAINAKQPEEIRAVVLASSNKKNEVSNLYIESIFQNSSQKDIYAGIVRRITSGTDAAFVEYGTGRHGFLPFREVASEYRHNGDRQESKAPLKVGQTIIVQVRNEERGEKGAMLTTYVSLPGTYLVLMPNRPSAGGVSKQLDMDLRRNMRQLSQQLNLPSSMSVILRTAGADRTLEDLKADLALLLKQWEAIQKAFKGKKPPFLIFEEVDILARTVRDYVRQDCTEVIIDDREAFEKVKFYANEMRPDILDKVRLYESRMPLFLNLDIEEEIESAFQRIVRLPSGGSIIIGRTEVGTSIDINSGSSIRHADIHETALKTNLEAAEVIAKQLRLRDVGGLIFIDFISMKEDAHRQQVEAKLRESTQEDRARTQIGNILLQFDVLVMSRQRLRPQLGKTTEYVCPTCEGSGVLRSIESLALSVIRKIATQLYLKRAQHISIEGSVELITYLSNEKRASIVQLEKDYETKLVLLPNAYWDLSKYQITILESEEIDSKTKKASYELITETTKEILVDRKSAKSLDPAVERFSKRIGKGETSSQLGFVGKLFNKIAQWGQKETPSAPASTQAPSSNSRRASKARRPLTNTSTNLRTRSTHSSLAVNVENQPKQTSAGYPIGADKKSTNKNTSQQKTSYGSSQAPRQPKKQPIVEQTQKVVLVTEPKSEISSININSCNELLANPKPFKRSAINHYGKEPRLKPRGY